MAIGKLALSALKALSYPDLNVKKNYKLERHFVNITHYNYLKGFYQTWDHKVHAGDHDVPVRIFSPPSEKKHSILLFFHGGGWVTGNIDAYDRTCSNLARITDRMVVSVDYRLAPEYKFPSAPEDCYAVARELFLNNSLLETHSDNITLIGDSAGGNLAAAVSLMARDRGEFLPKRQILIYPATYNDHTEQAPFDSIRENGTDYLLTSKRICDYMDLYIRTREDLQHPYFAPLLAEDLSNQPETLILTAQFDPLRDEGEAYGQALKESGNKVEVHRISDALHGFFTLPPNFAAVKEAYRYINDFISEVVNIV
jgi:acetyl esterase